VNYATGLIGSFGASLFFAYLFHTPKRCVVSSSLIGMIGYLVYMLFVDFVTGSVGGAFFASLAIAVLSEAVARIQHAPATIFASVAVIPLVPGGSLYQTMFYIVQNDYNLAVSKGVETILIAGCIALAIALVTAFTPVPRPGQQKRA